MIGTPQAARRGSSPIFRGTRGSARRSVTVPASRSARCACFRVPDTRDGRGNRGGSGGRLARDPAQRSGQVAETTRIGWRRGLASRRERQPGRLKKIKKWIFVDFVAGAAGHVSGGVRTRSVAPAGCPVEAERRVGRGVGCGRGPSAFFLREAPMPPERPGSQSSPTPAARSRGLPGRTKDRGDVRSGGRTGAPSSATARQAPAKDARQVEASAGCSA
jgi:hypothetical protein